ncbi:MAG: dehydrogenase [Actinomycetota bacterium]
MAAKKSRSAKKKPAPEEFRSEALAQALEKQDVAAVALALRHGTTIVPLLTPGDRDNPLDSGEVWTYRDRETGDVALLLFSDAQNKPANLPPGVGVYSAEWLRAFLTTHQDAITTVFLDIAGPHPMQADPSELLKALEA